MVMNTHVLHHSTVRTQLFKKLKHFTLDTLIAVGEWGEHTHVELFTLSNSKWQIREDYPFSKDISAYSILAVEKKFIIFGGYCKKRKVLINSSIKVMKTSRKYHFLLV